MLHKVAGRGRRPGSKVQGLRGEIFFMLIIRVLGGVCGVLAKNILPVSEIVVYLQREMVRMRV